MLISFSSYAQISIMSTYAIYNKLVSANHIKNPPKLVLVQTEEANAYSTYREIGMYTGMMTYLHNDDEMANILGHELGHFILKHYNKKEGSKPPYEFDADEMGAKLMRNAGFDVCKGAHFMKKRNEPWSVTHPSDEARYKSLGCH